MRSARPTERAHLQVTRQRERDASSGALPPPGAPRGARAGPAGSPARAAACTHEAGPTAPRRARPPPAPATNSHTGAGARAQPLDFVQLARDGERVEIPAGHHYVPVTRLVEVRLGETARERARARAHCEAGLGKGCWRLGRRGTARFGVDRAVCFAARLTAGPRTQSCPSATASTIMVADSSRIQVARAAQPPARPSTPRTKTPSPPRAPGGRRSPVARSSAAAASCASWPEETATV
jgi:hypothetical protein